MQYLRFFFGPTREVFVLTRKDDRLGTGRVGAGVGILLLETKRGIVERGDPAELSGRSTNDESNG